MRDKVKNKAAFAVLSVVFCLLAFATLAQAGSSPLQRKILLTATIEGHRVGWPETVQAIAIQETHAGTYKWTRYGIVGDRGAGFGQKSYGVMQVKIETAKDVLKRYPYLGSFETDEHLMVALLTDDEFNIRIAAHYFKMLYERFGDWRKAVTSYNAGPSNGAIGRDPNGYTDKIWRIIKDQVRQ